MATASSELLEEIVNRLAYLLEIDEAGWPAIARWLDSSALEQGIDLYTEWESPKGVGKSAVNTLRSYIDPKKFPERSLESF